MEKEDKIRYGIMAVLALVIVGMFVYSAQMNEKNEQAIDKNASGYSIDNADKPFKTLSYANAVTKLKDVKTDQMFYLGCRQCGHCQRLEEQMDAFLAKYKDKNTNRDLIYMVEAGFTCVPDAKKSDYQAYVELFDLLAEKGIVENHPSKSFGTPQFFYLKNGKVVDNLDKYGRSSADLEKMFKANNYRGFKK